MVIHSAFCQDTKLTGKVVDAQNHPLQDVVVRLTPVDQVVFTDENGFFRFSLKPGKYQLTANLLGYEPIVTEVTIVSGKNESITLHLLEGKNQLDEVVIMSESETAKVENTGFSVDAVETQKIKAQTLELNTVLNRTAGVRVRKTGGMGSDFNYSLDGMSGNTIRFFIDGVPMDYFGSSYSINNIPIGLIERVDIYKGVVPIELGSDALGGAINLVTNQNVSNYASASYSFGSFNTHQATIHGQWRFESGLTARLSTFYTSSDNNYKVWGRTVYYADETTGRTTYFTKDNPAERFNDDFKTATVKFDLGVTQKKWADQFFVTLLASDQKQGVQTGQTMAHVYGAMRQNESFLMPSASYQKRNFITAGLDVNVFTGYSFTEETVVDTTTNRYDWRGKKLPTKNPYGGEIGRDGSKSLFKMKDESQIHRLNATYQLPAGFMLGFNFLYSGTTLTGEDPFAVYDLRIPYLEPQHINSHTAGLSLEAVKFDDKLHANVFLKKYGFDASINDLVYTTEYEIVELKNSVSNWGGGLAVSYRILPMLLIKSSVEQATRLPSATEALGDGVTIANNPLIKPEQSFNANIGTVLGGYDLGRHGLKIAINMFYRDVTDKLQLNVSGGIKEEGQYGNIDAMAGTGAEIDIVYDYAQKLKLNVNGTYLDYRNTQKKDRYGKDNIVYGDRLRNVPYFMMNAGLEFTIPNFIQRDSKVFTYFQCGYVHEFFLTWPSMGDAEDKSVIPSQLVFDAGIGYTFPSQKVVLAVDISNMFNEQVYDNFLLQKPGRALSLKISYQLTQNKTAKK